MQLKITTGIKKSIITVELETVNFCSLENRMLDQFGEPIFHLEKMYQEEFAVTIHKKIRSNFKVKVKFDGTKNIEKASIAANEFIDEVKDLVPILMEDFLDKSGDIEIKAGTDIVDVTTHPHMPVLPRHPHGYYGH